MLILILAEKYLLQLKMIEQKNSIEFSDIDSVLKNYEWLWHGEAKKRPDSFKMHPNGNLCWFEIVFDRYNKPIITRMDFNDLMRGIDSGASSVKSFKTGEPFQMNGSGLNNKGFKKV